MSGKCLLDTNIVIALFANDAASLQHLAEADEIFVPCIVLGELYYGVYRSSRVGPNIARVDEFAASNVILECDIETARRYGLIKDTLCHEGRPIPENDLWIAALAQQHGLTLISRDSHFAHIPNLTVEAW